LAVAQRIGAETTTDVRNLDKQDASYTLLVEMHDAQHTVREQGAPGKS